MNDEHVDAAIEEMERGLRVDDPEFVHRVRNVQRSDAVDFVAVCVLLAVAAVLLTVGFASAALIPWLIGVAALFAVVLVDSHHRRTLR